MFKYNTPIGHAGNPLAETLINDGLPYIWSATSDCCTDTNSVFSRDSTDWGLSDTASFPLLMLPDEIIAAVASHLCQIDLLSLGLTCRSLHCLTQNLVSSSVVVDSEYSEFNLDLYEAAGRVPTFVKSSFRLRQLIRAVTGGRNVEDAASSKDTQASSQSQAQTQAQAQPHIRSLEFRRVPQDFLHYELKHFFNTALAQLHALTTLEVHCRLTNVPLAAFGCLRKLKRLRVSLELTPQDLRLYRQHTLPPQAYSSLFCFQDLQNLHLSLNFENNCANSRVLYHVFRSLIVHGSNDLHQFTKLAICNNSTLHDPESLLSNALVAGTSAGSSKFDHAVIKNVCTAVLEAGTRMSALQSLTFEGIVVQPEDARYLARCVALENLTQFRLDKVAELQSLDLEDLAGLTSDQILQNQAQLGLESKLVPGFLARLGTSNWARLSDLWLDYKECLKDSVVAFVCGQKHLSRLHVTIRWNMKSCRISDKLPAYVDALLHAVGPQVTDLSLDLKKEIRIGKSEELLGAAVFQKHLAKFVRLVRLKVLCGSINESFVSLLMGDQGLNLPNLRFLEIFGSGAGGNPNMALETIHHGVFDPWYKVQHVAIHLSQKNYALRFVKVNGCLFEVDRGAVNFRS